MINTIYLDLDDTLNNFTMTTLAWLGCDVKANDYASYPDVGYDIYQAWQMMCTNKDWLGRIRCEPDFWKYVDKEQLCRKAPLSPEAVMIYGWACYMVGVNRVFLCTKPFSPDVAAQKLIWARNHFPSLAKNYVLTLDKSLLAKPGTLLIDDHDDNCKSFRAAGGQAILVPRPWNSAEHLDTVKTLRSAFSEYQLEEV